MIQNLKVIFLKEYLQRIKSPIFWITTLMVPLFMVGITVIPILLASKTHAKPKVAVVDGTHQLYPLMQQHLSSKKILLHIKKNISEDELQKEVVEKKLDGYLLIPADVMDGKTIRYYARNVTDYKTISTLHSALRRSILKLRFKKKGWDEKEIEQLIRVPPMDTFRVTRKGVTKEKGGTFMLILLLFLSLYMIIIMYGVFVMNSVLDEKASRIMEILLSSVKPFPLFLGKILGSGAVGLTQYILWLLMGIAVFVFYLPSLGPTSAGIFPHIELSYIVYFFIFFILGFFLYASLYAGVGSLFNSQQEAQQMANILVMPLIVPVLLMQLVLSQPNGTVSTILSLVPFFTPLLMYLRILVETPPFWQITLSLVLTALTTLGMGYLSARLFRVGVLLYGKRPTAKEIWTFLKTG